MILRIVSPAGGTHALPSLVLIMNAVVILKTGCVIDGEICNHTGKKKHIFIMKV